MLGLVSGLLHFVRFRWNLPLRLEANLQTIYLAFATVDKALDPDAAVLDHAKLHHGTICCT